MTEWLLLHECITEDWTDVHACRSDPEVVWRLPFGPVSVDEVQEHLAYSHPHCVCELVLVCGAGVRGGCALALLDYEYLKQHK